MHVVLCTPVPPLSTLPLDSLASPPNMELAVGLSSPLTAPLLTHEPCPKTVLPRDNRDHRGGLSRLLCQVVFLGDNAPGPWQLAPLHLRYISYPLTTYISTKLMSLPLLLPFVHTHPTYLPEYMSNRRHQQSVWVDETNGRGNE